MNRILVISLIVLVIFGCQKKEGALFRNVSVKQSNLEFSNQITETDDLNILDYLYFYNGGGVAVGDVNNDDLPDIFFSANQTANKLFLNKGNLKFEDISKTAGIEGLSDWNTGAVMVDINSDGYLDIYVNAVVGINGFDGHNELYINNQDNTFTESAADYALDYDTYSSSTAFFDFDKDGDLDLFLLNHAVHTQNSFGNASLRNERNYETGDRLLRNDGNTFTDVSAEAGIYGGINGYGLGIAISDFNQDGWPDIYIGNDFHEDDYYYLNQGNGTFKESLKDYFGHTSRFSMGSDVADINHDGWPDLISLDMLPEDEKVLKASEGDDNVQTMKMRTEGYGYHYQYTRNMLFINQKDQDFMETALLSGVAATDWSWSALIEDFNQDGEQDIFISNGIPKRPNDLDFIRFVSSEQIQNKINDTKLVDQEAFKLMPSGKTSNYVFEGSNTLKFKDRTGDWIVKDSLVSGATAFADFDNDGDLDLVINNLNSSASLLENKTNDRSNYLKIKLNYIPSNRFGIGTKIFSYHNGIQQYKELYTVRGFQASSEPLIYFGYGDVASVDSLKIIWPDNSFQLVKAIETNQTLTIKPENTKPFIYTSLQPSGNTIFSKTENNLGIDFEHQEDGYLDFNRQKLIPYQVSNLGPAVALGDLNEDGKQDILFGGSKFVPSKIFIQKDSSYTEVTIAALASDSIIEDVSAVIADFNSDGKNDIFIGSGGADFFGKREPLLDAYFIKTDSAFQKQSIPGQYENASVVIENDLDNDGDLDLFVGNHMVTNDFGKIPESYVLINENGGFVKGKMPDLENLGMVTNAIWSDFDADGVKDLIVVGEWMSPKFFKNENGALSEKQMLASALNGLWQNVIEYDIDNDGDSDYLLANWGTNSKFKASHKAPLHMYYNDFDDDGQTETIVANFYNGNYYPIAGLDELSSQMVSLRKKFTAYKDFAGKPIEEIFDQESFDKSTRFEVHTLESGYLKNDDGRFKFIPFRDELQISPLKAFLKFDFDGDGNDEVLTAGNFFGVAPYHGRFDSFGGAILKNDGNVIIGSRLGLDLTQRSVRHLSIISLSDKPYLLVTFNDDKVQVYDFILKNN